MTSLTKELAKIVALQPSTHVLTPDENLLSRAQKYNISDTTVWQVINLGISIIQLKFERNIVKIIY